MAKNIMICFDGTCNHPKDAKQERKWFGYGDIEDNGITNILKLHLLFGGDLQNQAKLKADKTNGHLAQQSFYYSGVGTYGNKIQRIFNAGFAPQKLDVSRIIKNAKQDLIQHYQQGDCIYIFGFSRGAAIARRFATLVSDYIETTDKTPIKFLGVFDTVASIGIPNLDNDDKPISDVVFENHTIATSIESALHLLALDEKRTAFLPTLMNQEDKVTELWFAGAHADVGGGFWYDGLSDIALKFMLDWIKSNHGNVKLSPVADIDFSVLVAPDGSYKVDEEDLTILPNHLGKSHAQDRWWPIQKATLSTRTVRVKNADDALPVLHPTVIKRFIEMNGYRPRALKGVEHKVHGKATKFKGLNGHRGQ
ncbi:DUF2235 domain-containing protein [Psychrobium sp. 1_MG-2023]|uniref:phospholipase effector Tle1 domain-containing protein n=1 Tax=Psychrobium sp. 1_MG-2023 TaxID=3062624 RepID=UPI000C32396F|nr:DUF2235 domain-containing protein [Psychrobium sp. 1_MG-2023]MDP2560118.1 DUF2235 domain-containing protein [Psychrobium sp. 1_MG-2023]PKF56932.1 hypothetical protein CW748_07500 [Alteromonadales bacterium alter-6D02]